MQHIQLLITFILLAFLIYIALRKPSHDRAWSPDQKVLPSISTYGDLVTVHNVRQARYHSVDTYDVAYRDMTFTQDEIEKAWCVIEPFGNWNLFGLKPAHVFLSFELRSGEYLCISPEIRKKKGEKFSALKGFFKMYEIMYVLADERDVIQLRTTHRKDAVRLYPLTLSKDHVRALFKDMSQRINEIHTHAVFFNTALHSCTTNLVKHLRNISISLPRFHILYLFPGTLDSLLYTHKLIATTKSLDDAREHFYITEKAQAIGDTENFSQLIRKF